MRLLIADDEDYAREGLVSAFAWGQYGIDEIMQARDGKEALLIAGWFKPDIVLTDIRMPKLDGLEFAERLIRRCPDSQLLFMSGYMEIEYLKKAISLSAVEFVEKPVDLEKLEQAVKKATAFVAEKERNKTKEVQWKQLERQRLLNMLKLKAKDRELVKKVCEELDFPVKANYLAAVVWDKKREGGQRLWQALSDYWKQLKLPFLMTMGEANKYLLLIAYGDYQKSFVRLKCGEMADLEAQAIVGIGFETDSLMAVSQSCEIAFLNAEQSFFNSRRKVFDLEAGIPEMKKLNPGLYADFVRLLKEEPERVPVWFHRLTCEICKGGFYRQEDIVMLLSAFARIMIQEKNALLLSVEAINTVEEAEEAIRESVSIDEVIAMFDTILKAFSDRVERESPYSRLVRDTIACVGKSCRNPELSTADIAERMHLSAAHLNVLFRREMGVTVRQYISDYRLNLSKKLLLDGHFKIAEIAEACGYSNANYFTKVFKGSEGMAPQEYRRKYMK